MFDMANLKGESMPGCKEMLSMAIHKGEIPLLTQTYLPPTENSENVPLYQLDNEEMPPMATIETMPPMATIETIAGATGSQRTKRGTRGGQKNRRRKN